MGQVVGVIGSVIAGGAVIVHSFPLFLVGLALMGMARASADLGRFAAAEVHPPEKRGRAISNVVLGGTIGSVVGPLLVGPTGLWSLRLVSRKWPDPTAWVFCSGEWQESWCSSG